MNQVDPLNTTQ